MGGRVAKPSASSKPVVKKSNAGRPTKLEPSVVVKLKAAFANSFTVNQACMYAGISKPTFYDWLEKDELFSNQMTHAREQPTMKAKQVVVGSINGGDVESAKWWLKNKASSEFGGTPPPGGGQTINNFIVVSQEDSSAFTTPNTV